MKIIKYSSIYKELWDSFIEVSKNSLFMFKRDYMEYHKDRFIDNSLMIWDEDKLIAVLPASIEKYVLVSHGGLTFGGFITDSSMKQHRMNEMFAGVKKYMVDNGITTVIYKEIPHIYHVFPAQEDEYSLFWGGAKLRKMECSSVIDLDNRIKLPKGRKSQISKARREGVIVEDSDDFDTFIDLENEVLAEYHNASAVHTGAELDFLHSIFPDNIRLVVGRHNGRMVAGALLFISKNVVKTQYLASNDEARQIGALDLVLSEVMDEYTGKKKWFDFGKSTEGDGHFLNEGLIAQKEGFGGRTVMYRTWEWTLGQTVRGGQR